MKRAPSRWAREARALAACVFAVAAALAFASSAFCEEPLTLPILDQLPDGRRIGHWIKLQAGGGEPCLALLDTGSKGLMIRAERMGKNVARTGRRMRQGFQDGTVFEGEVVRVPLRLGPAVSSEPIFALAVDKAYCRKDRPDCPADALWKSPVAGIIGVGLGGTTALDHPFEFFGASRSNGFMVRGAGKGSAAALTLGLSSGSRNGFAMFSSRKGETRATKRDGFFTGNSVHGCLAFEDGSIPRQCGRILFDTGSSLSLVRVADMPAPPALLPGGVVPAGKAFRLSIDGLPDIAATTDLAPWSERIVLARDAKGGIILGGGVFRRLDILYDLKAQAIGLRPAAR